MVEHLPTLGEYDARRLDFETLISDTSASLFATPPEQIDLAVERALERVRIFFGADRCLLLAVSAEQKRANIYLGAYAEGQLPVSKDINLAQLFPWVWRTTMIERKPVRISRVAELPPEADVERENWAEFQVRSSLVLPIETGQQVKYLILLNAVEREIEWPDVFVTRLHLFGEMLVGALDRQEMFAAVLDAEERVNLAADSAEAGLWALDYATGVFWATERARTIFGYSPEEVITLERFDASVHPDDRDLVHQAMVRSRYERQPINVEYRIVKDEGRECWVITRGRPHFTSSSEPDRLTGVSIDITAPKQAEEKLRMSEARFQSGAELAGLAFYEVDFSKGTAYVDDRFCKLCGLTPDGAQGLQAVQFWIEHLHPEDYPRVMDQREQLHSGKLTSLSIQYRLLHPIHGQKWIDHLACAATRDAAGRAIRTFGVLGDITERMQAEEKLRQSYAEIEQLKDRLQAEGEYLKAEMKLTEAHGKIIGRSAGIRKTLLLAEKVARSDTSVLVYGETGTGKELIAQSIHQLSPRRDKVLVKVNCGALPAGLVESELFGREKGAFTGAMTRQIGRFEIADGSTLFLDEIGELPYELQSKLLRVLESGEFERLGNPKTIKVNVRVIAATNRDLSAAAQHGSFRKDLYYRLNVFPIGVPPLRERAEDIPLLVWSFLEEFSSRMGKKITRVQRKTMDALQLHTWPGNVRELRNVIERAVIITTGDTLRIKMFDEAAPAASPEQTLAEVEREHILRVLERTGGRVKGPKGAAVQLGIKPTTLDSRMKKLGILTRRQTQNDLV
jgi:formate hydrogenlyase transcriptional activator